VAVVGGQGVVLGSTNASRRFASGAAIIAAASAVDCDDFIV